MVGVLVIVGVRDGLMVLVTVGVGVIVLVGIGVAVALGDGVGVILRVGVMVRVAVRVGAGGGGSPTIVNRPELFQVNPTKIWTSYSPDSHWPVDGSHVV